MSFDLYVQKKCKKIAKIVRNEYLLVQSSSRESQKLCHKGADISCNFQTEIKNTKNFCFQQKICMNSTLRKWQL